MSEETPELPKPNNKYTIDDDMLIDLIYRLRQINFQEIIAKKLKQLKRNEQLKKEFGGQE